MHGWDTTYVYSHLYLLILSVSFYPRLFFVLFVALSVCSVLFRVSSSSSVKDLSQVQRKGHTDSEQREQTSFLQPLPSLLESLL